MSKNKGCKRKILLNEITMLKTFIKDNNGAKKR